MSSSSSEGWPGLRLTPRLGAALAASALLHAGLVAFLHTPSGRAWAQLSGGSPLSVALRADSPPASVSAGLQAALPSETAASRRERETAAAAAANLESGAATSPAASSPLPPLYYTTALLDVPPQIAARVEPVYPESAARRFLSGTVAVRLFIGRDGRVENAEIVRADPPGHFEKPVLEAFRAARFSPGMRAGLAVPVQVTLEVNFDSPPPPSLERP